MATLDEIMDKEYKPITSIDTAIDTFEKEKNSISSLDKEIDNTPSIENLDAHIDKQEEPKTDLGKFVKVVTETGKAAQKAITPELQKMFMNTVDKAVETRDYIKEMEQKIKGLDVMKVLTTPAGMYYASLGQITPSTVIESIAPDAFKLPEDWESAYFPKIKIGNIELEHPSAAFIKSVGAKPNAIITKLAQMMFIDTLAFKGMDAILAKLAPEVLSTAAKLSPEGLALYNRELAKDNLKITPEETKASFENAVRITEKQAENAATEAIRYDMSNDIYGGVKYNYTPDKGPQQLKKADYMDEFVQRNRNSMEMEHPEKIIPNDLTPEEVLPAVGEVDINPATIAPKRSTPLRVLLAKVSSPWNNARPVFDQVALHRREHDGVIRMMTEITNPIKKAKFNAEQEAAIIALRQNQLVTLEDGTVVSPKTFLKNWDKIFGDKSEQGIQALNAIDTMYARSAEMGKFKPEQIRENYFPHMQKNIEEFYANRPKQIETDEILNLFIKTDKRFLKHRKEGSINYSLKLNDITDAYSKWIADYIATMKYKKPIMEAVDFIKKLDVAKGDQAELYALNYFGELKKGIPGQADEWRMMNMLGKNISDSMVSLNLPATINNLTSGYLAMGEIGVNRWRKGVGMALEATFNKGPRAELLKKRWLESGLDEAANADYYKSNYSLIDKGLTNLIGREAVDKLNNISYSGMRFSEICVKKPTYLASYDRAEEAINLVKNSEPGTYPKIERWLNAEGIDPTKNIDTEAFKYAHFKTVKVLQDYSKVGATALNMNPYSAQFMRIMNWSVRAGENVVYNLSKAAGHLAKVRSLKELKWALEMPESKAALTTGLLTALISGISGGIGIKGRLLLKKYLNIDIPDIVEKGLGLTSSRVTGISNFMPFLGGGPALVGSPLLSTLMNLFNGVEKLYNEDPTSGESLLRSAMTLAGFKGTAPIWQGIRLAKTAIMNGWNFSDKWKIYAGDPMKSNSVVIDEMDPLTYITNFMSPIKAKSEEDYFNWVKQLASKDRHIKALRERVNREQKLKYSGIPDLYNPLAEKEAKEKIKEIEDEKKEYDKLYFERYPGVKKQLEQKKARAKIIRGISR